MSHKWRFVKEYWGGYMFKCIRCWDCQISNGIDVEDARVKLHRDNALRVCKPTEEDITQWNKR